MRVRAPNDERINRRLTASRAVHRSPMAWLWFGAAEEDDIYLDDVEPPFWETDVVTLGERERRQANYYEGLQPLWPRLGQLMVRGDARAAGYGRSW
jgi:hypothetical protein